MGIFLSRLAYSGVGSFHYLFSLLQFECRRLFRCNIAGRSRPFPRSMKYDNSRITMSENASTQTREETISNHSPPKQPEVGKLQADRQPFTVQASSRSDFPASTRREVKPMRKEACTNGVFDISEDTVIMMSNEEEKAEDKSKALPARNTSPLPRSKGEEGFLSLIHI